MSRRRIGCLDWVSRVGSKMVLAKVLVENSPWIFGIVLVVLGSWVLGGLFIAAGIFCNMVRRS